jgi:hypothetical protein
MNQTIEQAQQLTNLWLNFATQLATAGFAFKPGTTPPDAAEAVRKNLFETMSKSAEEFLRSGTFLSLMKQSMEASITWRKQLNDMLTDAHHKAEGVARQDVDNMLLAVRHLEHRTLDRLEQLADRLDVIEQLSQQPKAETKP